ncbi:MAG: hypothetical protein L6R41_006401 [Letrouitia leprolyta]|nr:MAG: hypothetical protein L6R41_006401 [Letrouitia leprolyta]
MDFRTGPNSADEEAPTPRAIQERLHKIRSMAKSKGTGNIKMVGTVGSKTNPGTPSPAKRATPKPKANDAPASAKRKRAKTEGGDVSKGKKVKLEDVTDEDDMEQEGNGLNHESVVKEEVEQVEF